MKCPYQTKVIHKPEYTEGYVTDFAEDITVFCECVKSKCPFYFFDYTSWGHEIIEHCRKAESESENK